MGNAIMLVGKGGSSPWHDVTIEVTAFKSYDTCTDFLNEFIPGLLASKTYIFIVEFQNNQNTNRAATYCTGSKIRRTNNTTSAIVDVERVGLDIGKGGINYGFDIYAGCTMHFRYLFF